MKSKRYVSSILGFIVILVFAAAGPLSAFASFNGVLPVPNAGTTPSVPTITLSSYSLTAGQTATVTFTFATAPASFTTSNITASNGAISGLAVTGNPLVYTATFTPTASINVSSNTISINQTVGMTTYTGTGSNPQGIAFDGTNMWTANNGGESVSKISPTGTVTTYTGTGSGPSAIAFDGTNMWTTNINGSGVSEITPSGIITTYTGAAFPSAIAFDGTNMWTANIGGNSVSKISPTGTVTTYTGTGSFPSGIAFDGTNMWTANGGGNSVSKITPSGTVTTYTGTGTGSGPYAIAFDGTNMWTANIDGSGVSKITPSGTITTYTGTGSEPQGIAFDGTNMWTANKGGNSVSKISPTGTVTTYTGTDSEPSAIAFDGTNMWTANGGGNSVTKVSIMSPATSSNYSIDTIPVAPTLTAQAATSLTSYTATLNGTITATGGANASAEGFNYGLTTGYELTPTAASGSFGTGAFTASLTGLTCNTTYHYESYATNTGGTGTSIPDATFTTGNCPVTLPPPVAANIQSHPPLPISVPTPIVTPPAAVPTVPTTPTAPTTALTATPTVSSPTPTAAFTHPLRPGTISPTVQSLQQFLNAHGFTIAATGPGSPGNETDYYGSLTAAAVTKFQEAYASAILAPLGLTAGTGVFGAMTMREVSVLMGK